MANEGVSQATAQLPHFERIQAAFGHHDLGDVRARVGGSGGAAAVELGARAYTTGPSIAFREAPDVHLAAHEAAHVIQQRAGVHLKDGLGRAGDRYEREADAVADTVVQGRSAEALLDRAAPQGSGTPAVQAKCGCGGTCAKCSYEEENAVQLAPQTSEAPHDNDAAILAILDVPVAASDTPGQHKRVEQLIALFSSVAGDDARALLARLTSKQGRLAKSFHYKLSTATRKQLLAILQLRSAQTPPPAPAAATPSADARAQQRQEQIKLHTHADPWAARASADGPNNAMLDGIPVEKWDPDAERWYRANGDSGLADAMRACRVEGNGTCNFVLTEAEALHWWRKSKEEPSWGNCPGGPNGAAQSSGAANAGGAAPAAAAGTLAQRAFPVEDTAADAAANTAANDNAYSSAANTAANDNAYGAATDSAAATTTAETGALAPETGGAVTTVEGAEAASIAPEVLAVAAPVVIVAGTALTLAEATEFDNFKRYIATHFHIYTLGDPLARCISGCHYGAPPKAPKFDFPDIPVLPPAPRFPTDFTPDDTETLRRWLDQTPETAGPRVAPRVTPQAPPDVDIDEKPEPEPRNCDDKADDPCLPVAIPRKGGDSKYTRRHNRGADGVTAKKYKGKDICIDGKAFDGLLGDVLWEVKGHAWTYATIYKDPIMAKKILDKLVKELLNELDIASKCKRKFKVGVCDQGLLDALERAEPSLIVELISC